MTSLLGRSIFLRPKDILLNNSLQAFQIINHLSQHSNETLTSFRFPREINQKKILNFASFTFQSEEIANKIIQDSNSIKILLNSKINKEIGLKEISKLINLDLHEDSIYLNEIIKNENEKSIPLTISTSIKIEKKLSSSENLRPLIKSVYHFKESENNQDYIEEKEEEILNSIENPPLRYSIASYKDQDTLLAFGGFHDKIGKTLKNQKENQNEISNSKLRKKLWHLNNPIKSKNSISRQNTTFRPERIKFYSKAKEQELRKRMNNDWKRRF